eukprot:TRINITY_DN8571_c0_g1_i1.p1 TRINITY_DN8571_c0_g1~~TRINITY_DN8571_c0_g1_i1.p1  ORF type:complete len:453 (+),score=63.63 TRINITY_DN8571_c0_g1_i1:192-1361(+)
MAMRYAMSQICANMSRFLGAFSQDILSSGPLQMQLQFHQQSDLSANFACIEPALEKLAKDVRHGAKRDDVYELYAISGSFEVLRAFSIPCLLESPIGARDSCFGRQMRNAMGDYVNSGDWDAARSVFEAATTTYVDGIPLVRWRSFHETPLPHFLSLDSKPFWESDLTQPIPQLTSLLRNNWPIFLEEYMAASKSSLGQLHLAKDAYKEIIYQRWVKMELWDCGWNGWNTELCKLAPKTCKLFQGKGFIASDKFKSFCPCWTDEMCNKSPIHCARLRERGLAGACGTRVGRLPLHEKVGWIVLKPNQAAPYHTGDQRRINFFICLSGCEGAFTVVGGVVRTLPLGEVTSYQDGFAHLAINNGESDRVLFLVSMLHPHLWDLYQEYESDT